MDQSDLCWHHQFQFWLVSESLVSSDLQSSVPGVVGGVVSRLPCSADWHENPLLQQLVKWEESDQEGGVARYFEKVMRLFEQVPAPKYVIKVADSAVLLIANGHPESVSLKPMLQAKYCPYSHTHSPNQFCANPKPIPYPCSKPVLYQLYPKPVPYPCKPVPYPCKPVPYPCKPVPYPCKPVPYPC